MLHAFLLIALATGIRWDGVRNAGQGAAGCTVIAYEGEGSVSEHITDVRGGADCAFVIHADLPLYRFHLVANPERNVFERIEVVAGDRRVQTLTVENETVEPPYRDAEFFGIDDFDFDGYNDIKLLSWWGVTGNKGHVCWLFDPKKNVFVKNEELSRLTNAEPDPATRTITSSDVGGMAGKIYGRAEYRFDDKRALILIRREKQDWDEQKKCFVRTVEERRKGKMVVVSTEIVK